MAMDRDVLAQIAELARQKQSLCGAKSVRHAFPAVCTQGEVAPAANTNSATTRLESKNIPIDKAAKRK